MYVRLPLPPESRIQRSKDVRSVFDRGRSAAAGPVVVYARQRDDERPPRFALVVSKRWGGAVERNRIRRLLRESFRTSRHELPQGFDFLLLPRNALEQLEMSQVRTHLMRAARRAVARCAEAEAARAEAASGDPAA